MTATALDQGYIYAAWQQHGFHDWDTYELGVWLRTGALPKSQPGMLRFN